MSSVASLQLPADGEGLTQRQGFSGIDKVVEWARTDHGGKQFPLFAPPPRGGCMRWGICETSPHKAGEP